MRFKPLDVIAPAYFSGAYGGAEILNSSVWIWMHSSFHRGFPLHTLSTLLLPDLKRKQFIFASEDDKPVFFMSWAQMSHEAASRYIRQPAVCILDEDGLSADRTWMIDWLTSFGHPHAARRRVNHQLFDDRCLRSLYHRKNGKGTHEMHMHGVAAIPSEARHWLAANPVV